MHQYELFTGDCRTAMLFMDDSSIDSIVCDPPYGISFMAKHWDYDVPDAALWADCLRVLKPGAHLLAFFSTRTYHRGVTAIEDAGFEIRDTTAWVYGSGFPKSMDVSKAIDKAAGAEREVIGLKANYHSEGGRAGTGLNMHGVVDGSFSNPASAAQITAPATDDARRWEGWGTALKPAMELIVIARKPLIGTVVENVLVHGTGGLNIDGCRVGDEVLPATTAGQSKIGTFERGVVVTPARAGRFPANLIHDGSPEVVDLFPDSNGAGPSLPRVKITGYGGGVVGSGASEYLGGERIPFNSGRGSAARFFTQIKREENEWEGVELPSQSASTAEKNLLQQRQVAVSALAHAVSSVLPAALRLQSLSVEPSTSATASELRLIASSVTQTIQSIEQRFWLASKPARLSLSLSRVNVVVSLAPTGTTTITASHWKFDGSADPVTFSIARQNSEAGGKGCGQSTASRFMYCTKASRKDRGATNGHPTVKPTDLMAYLCRLVTPPGGLVFDPFMGSGSTGKAAIREGFRFIGCDLSPEYVAIAEARISHEAAIR